MPKREASKPKVQKEEARAAAPRARGASPSGTGSLGAIKRMASSNSMGEPARKAQKSKEATGGACVCIRCKETPENKAWARETAGRNGVGSGVAVGNACRECKQAWAAGWALDGSFEEVVEMCENNPDTAAEFEASVEFLAGRRAKDFAEIDVDSDEEYGVEISRSFLGLTVPQFSEIAGGCRPKDVGEKIRTLDGPDGEKFKGVLVNDPDQPYIKYKVFKKFSLKQRSKQLKSERHVRAEQAAMTMEFLRNRKDFKERMCKGLRFLTIEELRLKAAEKKSGENPDDDHSADDGEGEGDARVRDMVSAPALALAAAPPPNQSTPKKFVSGASSSAGGARSVAGSTYRAGRVGMPTSDDESDRSDTDQPMWVMKLNRYDITKAFHHGNRPIEFPSPDVVVGSEVGAL